MPRGRPDIANTALRIFLQEIGAAYDEERKRPPYKGGRHFEEIKDFFGGRCCYCGVEFGSTTPAVQDHLIPMNKADLGLHAWGNIVPTLTDSAARLVNFHPRPTTVSALRRLRPTGYGPRVPGVERTTYRVRARLVETKLEDDGDYHLVIADLRHPGLTMIVEFPASNCVRGAVHRKQILSARAAFVRACGYPSSSSFSYLRGTATITGVGFFDFPHGQTGVAPNAIELHPVLSFRSRSVSAC